MELPMRPAPNAASAAGVDAAAEAARKMLQDIKCRMQEFFNVLIRMPHIEPDALRLPPETGWENVGDTRLRARGKTEGAINFLKQLPCLVHGAGMEQPSLTPRIQSVYFSEGIACRMPERHVADAPGNVVWIGEAKSADGCFLLLDTSTGQS